MNTIENSMLEEIYLKANNLAKTNRQTIGEKVDYYITLEQLEKIIQYFED